MPPGGFPAGGGPPNNKVGDQQGSRTLPTWMDSDNSRGQLTVLSLKAAVGYTLPRNPFVLSKTIETEIGPIDGAATENKGTAYALKVRNPNQVRQLLELTQLYDGTRIVVCEHPTLNIVQCVVSCFEAVDMSEEELEAELRSQGVTKVRRIKRRSEKGYINTPTVVLTIRGTVIPPAMYFGMLRCPTRKYFPSPMQCYNCYGIGHTKARCSNVKKCRNCGKEHVLEDGVKCKETTTCANCKGPHEATSKSCKVIERENGIIALKVEFGYTFPEARRLYEQRTGSESYANTVGSNLQKRLEDARTNCSCACQCGAKQIAVAKANPKVNQQKAKESSTESSIQPVSRKQMQQNNSNTQQQQPKTLKPQQQQSHAPKSQRQPTRMSSTPNDRDSDFESPDGDKPSNRRSRSSRRSYNKNTGTIPKVRDELKAMVCDIERTPKRNNISAIQ